MEMYRGMIDMAEKYDVTIIGGNVSSADKLIINISVHGYTSGTKLLTRSSAKPGDRIAVTGFTGLSAAGLEMFKTQLTLEKEASALFAQAHLRPHPRVSEGQALVKYGVKTAIDISDGLLADLGHICEASKVSAKVSEALVPVSPALKDAFKDRYMDLALTGGEDYELLFTAPEATILKLKPHLSCPVTIIGEIAKQGSGVEVIGASGNAVPFKRAGWNHFK
jgi:thiamine-monophosphate kinase